MALSLQARTQPPEPLKTIKSTQMALGTGAGLKRSLTGFHLTHTRPTTPPGTSRLLRFRRYRPSLTAPASASRSPSTTTTTRAQSLTVSEGVAVDA